MVSDKEILICRLLNLLRVDFLDTRGVAIKQKLLVVHSKKSWIWSIKKGGLYNAS